MSPKLPVRHYKSRQRCAGGAAVNLLTVAGVAGLAMLGNHGTQYDVRQTRYASREDCLKDWGTQESCPANSSNGGAYFGPRYYWDPKRSSPVVVTGDGAEHVATNARVGPVGSTIGSTAVVGVFARGGFGRIGRGFSSGRGG